MSNPADVLTPDAFRILAAIADAGSFAGAARALGLVPSALTYRVRQIEDALDVLLFDRSSRQARPTAAGAELLAQAARLPIPFSWATAITPIPTTFSASGW